jgi:MFS transporter, DHA2 family, multidrug resistance protein
MWDFSRGSRAPSSAFSNLGGKVFAASSSLVLPAVIAATFLEVLDSTVVSVALPYISGKLSVSNTESAWGSLAYLCANAVTLPVAGALTGKIGKRNTFLFSLIFFAVASALCSSSTTLVAFSVWRIFQGIAGGLMQPIAYAAALEAFPGQKQRSGIAVIGFITTLAPTVGPILGGWLTDTFGWELIFLINVPVVLVILLIMIFHYWPDENVEQAQGLHAWSILLLGMGTLIFQIILLRGDYYGWFQSPFIVGLSAFVAGSAILFFLFQWYSPRPLLQLRSLMRPPFLSGCFLIGLHNFTFFGSTLALPLLLENARGLSALTSGLYIIPRGVGSLIGMLLAAPITRRLNAAYGFCLAQVCIGISLLGMAALPLEVNGWDLFFPQLLAGFGSAIGYVAIASMTYRRIEREQMVDASAAFGYIATIGASLGVAAATTSITSLEQQVLHDFASTESFYGATLLARKREITHILQLRTIHVLPSEVNARILHMLAPQAQQVATNLFYEYLATTSFVLAILVFFFAANRSILRRTNRRFFPDLFPWKNKHRSF